MAVNFRAELLPRQGYSFCDDNNEHSGRRESTATDTWSSQQRKHSMNRYTGFCSTLDARRFRIGALLACLLAGHAVPMTMAAASGKVEIPAVVGNERVALTMALPGQIRAAVDVTTTPVLVAFYLPKNADPAGLRPQINVPEGFSIHPAADAPVDFRQPVTYTLSKDAAAFSWQTVVYHATMETALCLNGERSHVSIAKNFGIFDGKSDFTIEFWIYARELPENDDWSAAPVPVTLFGENMLRITMADGCRTPNRIGARLLPDRGQWQTPVNTTELQTNVWYHIAVTYSTEGGWKIYTNGSESGSKSGSVRIRAANGGSFIGGEPGDGRNKGVNGLMKDVRFWKVAHSAEQIRQLMNEPAFGVEPDLVACWPMNHSHGNTAMDLSSAKRHGTVVDARWGLASVSVEDVAGHPAVAGLIALLSTLDDLEIPIAVAAIGAIGSPQATQALIDLLANANAVTRAAACQVLGNATTTTTDISALVAMLGDSQASVRDAAVAVLAVKADKAAVNQALIAAVGNAATGRARELAAQQLGNRKVQNAAPALIDALSDSNGAVIAAAAEAIGIILVGTAEPSAVQPLIARLADSRQPVRDAVAVALGQLGGTEALQALLTTAYADWPMWGYDLRRSGKSPILPTAAENSRLQWKRQLPSPRRAWPQQLDDKDKLEFDLSYSPIVVGNRVFVASMNNDSLSAYDLANGNELWRYYADAPARLAPAAWNNRIYMVSDDGHLHCVNAESGQLIWKFDARPIDRRVLGNDRVISFWAARGAPLVDDGVVYFAAGIWPFLGTFLFAVDATSGELVWSNTSHATDWQSQPHGGAFAFAGVAPQGYLAAADGRLVVSGGRALPALFNQNNGALISSRIDGKDVGGYQVSIDGEFYYNHGRRYRLSDGSAQGSQSISNQPLERLVAAVADQLDSEPFEAVFARGRLLISSRQGTLYCFGPTAQQPVVHALSVTPPPTSQQAAAAGQTAEMLLRQASSHRGYALFLGAGTGDLLEQIAIRSDLHIVAVEPDQDKIEALRRRFDAAGLYGRRIALIPGNPAEVHYPSYISTLIVMEDPTVLGKLPDTALLDQLYAWLRPYNGRALLLLGDNAAVRGAFAVALQTFTPENGQVEISDELIRIARTGALPGAGQWTHQYADSQQTVMSGDSIVRPPFGPIWFGGTSNTHILPRHAAGPRPQVAGGRLVILGVEGITCRCVFTGQDLWQRDFPGIGHAFTDMSLEQRWQEGAYVYMTNQPGAAYIGSPYVTLPDAIYIRYQRQIFRIDPETGRTTAEWKLPALPEDDANIDWGHISVSADVLLTTTNPYIFRKGNLGSWGDDSWDATSSKRLVALDRHSGKVLWTHDAVIGFRHNAIASADNRVFVNDLLTEEAVGMARRRGVALAEKPRMSALNLQTGEVLWSIESDVFGTFLSHSAEHDILIEGGSRDTRRVLKDEPSSLLIARRGADGTVIWQRDGSYQGPLVIHGASLLSGRPGPAICLLTGTNKTRQHPLTNQETEWSYWKAYGCGMANASEHLLLFRSGSAGFADLEHDGGTGTIGGFKTGCTASMIAADGILSAPEYTRTCTCSYQNQTSLGLIHMPEMEMWMVNQPISQFSGTIRQLGINFGAPGERRDADGTLWIPFPHSQAPGPKPALKIAGNVQYFHRHSLLVNSKNGLNWVAASGVRHAEKIELLAINGQGTYTIRLHFAEPDQVLPGERLFSILINGVVVATDVDIMAQAGAANHAIVISRSGILVGKSLVIELKPSPTTKHPPILGGIELRAEHASISNAASVVP